MSDAPHRIRALLSLLSGRERRLGALSGLLELCALVLVVWAAAMLQASSELAVRWGLVPGSVAVAVGALAVIGLVARRWRRAGRTLHQAHRVEEALPELRGRLLTVVERPKGARVGESELLLGLAERKAARMVVGLDVSAIHPAGRLRPWWAGLAWAVLLFVLAGLWAPGGPLTSLAWLAAGTRPAHAEPPEPVVEIAEDTALVGDLVLVYVYPDYTGLDPLEVPNSNGTAHGPAGTQVTVRARTRDSYTTAAL